MVIVLVFGIFESLVARHAERGGTMQLCGTDVLRSTAPTCGSFSCLSIPAVA